MFLASFALFTWVFTSFLRFKRGVIFFIGIFLLSLFILLIITGIKKKEKSFFFTKLKQIFLTQTLAFLLASIAISLSLLQKDQNLISNFFSFSTLKIETPKSAFTPFMEEVLVLEQTKPNTYIVQTQNGKEFFLKTKKIHHIGSNLRLGASLKSIDSSKLYTELSFS
jgi:hypothetical protein